MKLAALVLALVLAACGDGAVFATADGTQLRRSLHAASADDLLRAEQLAWGLGGTDAVTACPRVVTVGARATVEGGCENPFARYQGTLVIDNHPDQPAHDPAAPIALTFDDFAVVNRGTGVEFASIAVAGTVAIDGFVGATRPRTDDGALTVDTEGAAITTDLREVGDLDGWTSITGSVAIAGLGSAEVEGRWSDRGAGSVTLRGDDELTFYLDDLDAGACMRYTIDGGDHRLCGW